MKPIPVPPDVSPEDYVSVALRQCALIVDPKYGSLAQLAGHLGLHETTLRVWIRNGRVPHKHGLALVKRFGKKFIDFDRLVGDDTNE